MKCNYSRNLGLIAVFFFTATANSQTRDTLTREKKIDEVVLIGYGTVKKKNATSAIENVKAEVFEDRPIYNVTQALQGNAAGVNVVQNSGKPGQTLNIKIRGNNSISSGVDPLYVVDGIQTKDISGINPDDIVDITVLKDATSAAIYGINGSSGVVIVTTKRAKANKSQLNFNAYWGVSRKVNNVDVLNPEQYKALMSEINPAWLNTINDPMYAGINTDWVKKVYRTGFDQNYNVNYAFGDEKIRAYTALGYQNVGGIVSPSDFGRLSAKINLDAKITNWLKVISSMNYIDTNTKNTADNNAGAQGGVILSALTTPTFMPAYGSEVKVRPTDGSGNYLDGYKDGQFALNPFTGGWENPVSFMNRESDKTHTQRFLSNLGIEVDLIKNLVWKSSVSLDHISSINEKFLDPYRSEWGRQQKGSGSKTYLTFQDLNFENTVNYTLKSGSHDLGILGGFQMHERKNDGQYYWGSQFANPLQSSFEYDKDNPSHGEIYRKDILKELSFFGRVVYTLDNKYTVMAVFRENGSSALYPDKRWGFFPGISASWNIANENFLKGNSTLSDFKIRGGWGKTGNASGIPAYAYYNLDRLNKVGGAWSTYQTGSDVAWEVTTDNNFGVDLGFANNRIKLTADFYKRKTDDLIMPIPIGLGIPDVLKNVGSMENKGMEFTLNTVNFKTTDFSWNTNFNISFNKSKVLELKYVPIIDNAGIPSAGNLVRFSAGQPISSFYGYQYNGVDPSTGNIIYNDLDGNGVLSAGDRTFIGNPNPNYTFGFTNNFTYKNWYMDLLVIGSQGNDIYNASRFELEMMDDHKNQSIKVLNRWMKPGDITDVPRAKAENAKLVSDRFIEDGSFIKLKSVTIGYNFIKPMKGVSKLNLYVTGQNLYTWTNYSGFDPEVNAFANTNGVLGVDYGTYPQVRTFVFGLKANF